MLYNSRIRANSGCTLSMCLALCKASPAKWPYERGVWWWGVVANNILFLQIWKLRFIDFTKLVQGHSSTKRQG